MLFIGIYLVGLVIGSLIYVAFSRSESYGYGMQQDPNGVAACMVMFWPFTILCIICAALAVGIFCVSEKCFGFMVRPFNGLINKMSFFIDRYL